jgi:hypothetical protein
MLTAASRRLRPQVSRTAGRSKCSPRTTAIPSVPPRRGVVALVKRERLAGRAPVTNGGVVAQVWRGGSGRQAPVARLLAGAEVVPVDDGLGRRAGMLPARAGQADAIDAAVVCLAADGILTSDPGELRVLAETAGVHVELIPV